MEYKKVGTLFNYIGGKGWLKEKLRTEISELLKNNKVLDTYVEPFSGGLGAFINVYDILLDSGIKKVILNDINIKIINFYRIVKESPDLLIQEYVLIENKYKKLIKEETKKLHKTKDKEKIKKDLIDASNYFIESRKIFNKLEPDNIKSAAYLLFLQNHCFNGVYRENGSGFYNTPFNWDCKIFEEDKITKKIKDVHEVFNLFDVEFKSVSFEDIEYNNNSLYYLDPPYINEDELVENKYNKSGFNADTQLKLINLIKKTKFIYSNHKHNLLLNEFEKLKDKIVIYEIGRKNIISASNESRKKDKLEILVIKK
jgi:DNA adenine methylase